MRRVTRYFLYVICINVIRFAKGDLIRAIISTEKSHFEILITVNLKNAWCPIFHQSIVIQGNLADALFHSLRAELLAICILDSFFISTTSDYIGMVGQGW